MLMIMWIYRVVFANFVWFASSGVIFVIGLFMLKRGVYAHRPRLRKFAFGLIFAAAFKTLMIDERLASKYLLCDLPGDTEIPLLPCSGRGIATLDFLSMLLFILAGYGVFQAYRAYMPEKKRDLQQPGDVHLRFWANLNLWTTTAMICWLAAPWAAALTIGAVPAFFGKVPWQWFALGNLYLMLLGFWKSESCAWSYDITKKDRMRHLNDTWTPRDTLWLNVFLFVIAMALSYVSQDVLSLHGKMTPQEQQDQQREMQQ